MLIEQLSNQCKDKGKIIQNGRFFLIQQNLAQHGDFLTISWIIKELQNDRKVNFITFRENYAHYLSLSKKLGKSIQPYIKSKQLLLTQCFQSSYCVSQLPLTQSSPLSYTSPPTTITKYLPSQLLQQQNLFEQNAFVVIDSIGYLDEDEVVFRIYQEAMAKGCRMLMAGAREGMKVVGVVRGLLDLYVRLENDVGNYGRLRMVAGGWEVAVLWRFLQGKFQVTQHVKL